MDTIFTLYTPVFNSMNAVMDEVAKVATPVTEAVLAEACIKNPEAVGEKLKRWKHLFRA